MPHAHAYTRLHIAIHTPPTLTRAEAHTDADSLPVFTCSHTRMHMYTHTLTYHMCTHTLTYRHKVHTYIHVLTAGRHAHTCSHTFDHRGRKTETHQQKPRSEARHLLPREQRSSGNTRPWRPKCPTLAVVPRCPGLPLSRSQAPVSVPCPTCGLHFLLPPLATAVFSFTSAFTIWRPQDSDTSQQAGAFP